jgi:hypothetical protein
MKVQRNKKMAQPPQKSISLKVFGVLKTPLLVK